jgi:hypothetical protein
MNAPCLQTGPPLTTGRRHQKMPDIYRFVAPTMTAIAEAIARLNE